jgi:ParB family chromosome partitioning protein
VKVKGKAFPKTVGEASNLGVCQAVPIESIIDSPFQVRVDYGDIEGLARDISQKGLLQPILLRPRGGKFEIVHGHRRLKAVRLLGWKYIDAFVRELTDSEAITIQGSENIWRKDYTPIEEAKLYYNYREFLQKERNGKKVSIKEVAEAFQASETDVIVKIYLLDLPQEIQDKIHRGEIPFSKAKSLTILTREAYSDRNTPGQEITEPAPRTDRFYYEIKRLTEEIEKGPQGGLRTEGGVAEAAQLIRDGVPYEEAVNKAKVKEAIEIAQKQLRKGSPPEEVLKDILEHQEDPEQVVQATIEANIGLLKKLLKEKLIVCPYCGKPDLVWGCNGKPLLEEEGE